MKSGVIPSSWMAITGIMSAAPHLALLEEVDKRGIDHKDLAQVRAVWEELNSMAEKKVEAVLERREKRRLEAEADTKSIEPLAHVFPRIASKVRRAKEKK